MADDSSTDAVVLVLDRAATITDVDRVMQAAEALHLGAAIARGDGWAAVAIGDGIRAVALRRFRELRAVEAIVPVRAPYRLASREVFNRATSIRLEPRSDGSRWSGIEVGGSAPIAVFVGWVDRAGDQRQLQIIVRAMRKAGGSLLHVGRFGDSERSKPGQPAVAWVELRRIADELGFGLCVEVADSRFVDGASQLADVLVVGSRSMQDFNLLRALGEVERPVILKRGSGATVEEFLLAAEYVLVHGNGRVILCESGIRTFDANGRPRFEINAIPVVKQATHLPLVADPTHSTSDPALIVAMARAAIAAGADGLMLDLPDAGRTGDSTELNMESLKTVTEGLKPIAVAVGRQISGETPRKSV